jgi:hypothetical protein
MKFVVTTVVKRSATPSCTGNRSPFGRDDRRESRLGELDDKKILDGFIGMSLHGTADKQREH